ncbi:hypothetical protein [Geoalkalibacter halelectricus]|uniref:Cytochrome c7-like domain-containing protein n=1 Tax=Geoalkalibacter halelectricus TaxID=2847045 RepID=A0ABY5ZS87_9BACT|nr:hypothetical protein [Geoalkalibacter halelectricus]MDO3377486.1 hypothetical protein [Geoalkalibacter halelectricus]UWZ80755.1 hypothetical protein L9S41_04970 [Geoalkalibacter halelectricus]
MKKSIVKILACATVLSLGLVMAAAAAVPPPPVNQFIGIPDTIFANLEEADCRVCHGANPPEFLEGIIDTTYLPDRHHNLIGDTIPVNNSAPFGEAGETYECLSCHNLAMNDDGVFDFVTFRDCNFCHTGASPHHTADRALAGNCQACHGSLVDRGIFADPATGQFTIDAPWIPTYQPSNITPYPSAKPNAGPNGEGTCVFCHAPSVAKATGINQGFEIDPLSGVMVYNNADTHHLPGLFVSNKCSWCHPAGTPSNSPTAIRTCQNCHGIPSLHNIQWDNVNPQNPNIQPGQMDPWYGHIGASSDCFGCHGFTRTSSVAPQGGPIIPQISGMTQNVVTAGAETTLEIHGYAFVNTYSPVAGFPGVEYKSVVVLTDAAGNTYELAPVAISPSVIEVTVPAYLPIGNYQVVAKKATKLSNPETLVVKSDVAIASAEIQPDGTIVIDGKGFGKMPPQAQGLGVYLDNAPADVISWQDGKILVNAAGAQAGQTVDVLSTYAVSAQLTGEIEVPVVEPPVVEEPPVAEEPPANNRGRGNSKVKSDNASDPKSNNGNNSNNSNRGR